VLSAKYLDVAPTTMGVCVNPLRVIYSAGGSNGTLYFLAAGA